MEAAALEKRTDYNHYTRLVRRMANVIRASRFILQDADMIVDQFNLQDVD
jgi:hypothetical protein